MSRRRPGPPRPPSTSAPPAAAVRLRWPLLVLVAATLLAYGNSLSGPFIRDDVVTIVENVSLRSLTDLKAVLMPERELPVSGRPLVNLSFAVNYAIGGLSVRGYHLANVAIHLICGLVIFGLVRRSIDVISARSVPAPQVPFPDAAGFGFATALLWLIHPLNTETVNYVTQRSELLLALFYLLTVYACLRALDSSRPRFWALLAIAACASGMGCKESMATAPVVIVLFDGFVVFGSLQDAVKKRWRLYLALAATELVLLGLNWSGPRIHSAGFSTGVSPWTYLLNQAQMLTKYLALTAWPHALVGEYGWPRPLGLADVWPQATLVVSLLVLTVVTLVRWPVPGFLGAWFFITLAPTSSIVPIATEVGAERRMYLPLVACVVLAGLAGRQVLHLTFRGRGEATRARTTAGILLAVVAVALGWRTWSRNQDYRSSLVLAQLAVDRFPNGVARLQLAAALNDAGRKGEALDQMRLAVIDNPRAHYALGVEFFNDGRLDDAIAEMQAFVREQPYLVEVITARQILGRAFARQRRWPEAIEQYWLVLGLRPSAAEAADTAGYLADALYEQQAFADAIPWYRRFLETHQSNAVALTRLGRALIATDQLDEALAAFRRAVDAAPDDATARKNLATALYDHRDLEETIRQAERAVALGPADAQAHQLLGRALAVRGDIARAVDELEQAVRLDPQNAEMLEDLRKVAQIRGARPESQR